MEKEERDEMAIVERNKKFRACMKMIMEPAPLPETVKTVFVTVCHKPIEEAIYGTIIYGAMDADGGSVEEFVEKGAKLYHIHTMLNQKLNRSDHIGFKERDEYLLNCIVSEMKRRKQDFPDTTKQLLKDKIFMKYCNMDLSYVNGELIAKDPDEAYDDFDDYMQYLFKQECNGIIEIQSFNHLWSLLGRKRDQTFKKRRPSKDELYMFCVGLALDYKVYCRLKKLLLQKMEKEGNARSTQYAQYLDCDRRDAMLKLCLENMDTRLLIAESETKDREFIPGLLLKSVNYDLEEKGLPQIGRRKKQHSQRRGI